MLFDFDAVVASLVFVLPGFLVVGTIVALAPRWEKFNPNPATYVLMSLGASIPLHLGFAWLSTRGWAAWLKPWFRAFESFDLRKLTQLAFTVEFLKPVFMLLALSLLLGLGAVGLMHAWQWWKCRGGEATAVSRKTVWRQLFDARKHAPNVLVFTANGAYKGQPLKVTTDDGDPHVFLNNVSLVAVDPETRIPDWGSLVPLDMEGLLLDRKDIREMWFLNDEVPE